MFSGQRSAHRTLSWSPGSEGQLVPTHYSESPGTREQTPVGLDTLQHQPQSHRLFPGVRRVHTLLGQPSHGGKSASPRLQEDRALSPAWDSAFLLPWFRAGTWGLTTQEPHCTGGPSLFCDSGFSGFLNGRRNITAFLGISSHLHFMASLILIWVQPSP